MKNGNNSNLPAIISNDRASLAYQAKPVNEPVGPINVERPGPTLLIQVSDAEKAVTRSTAVPLYKLIETIIPQVKNIKI